MKREDHIAIQAATLDDYLARWHGGDRGKKANGTDRLDGLTCRDAISSRGWDLADDLHYAERLKFVIRTIDSIVTGDDRGQGAMVSPFKDAITSQARNLYTGFNAWINPRLPRDSMERARILAEARIILLARMKSAGIEF